MTVRPRPHSDAPTPIASIIAWAMVGLVIGWVALAALPGLLVPVVAAAGP